MLALALLGIGPKPHFVAFPRTQNVNKPFKHEFGGECVLALVLKKV